MSIFGKKKSPKPPPAPKPVAAPAPEQNISGAIKGAGAGQAPKLLGSDSLRGSFLNYG